MMVLMYRGIDIRTNLTPGDHILRCELLEATADPGGGTEFRIISVMRYISSSSSFFPSSNRRYLLLLFLFPFLVSSPPPQ